MIKKKKLFRAMVIPCAVMLCISIAAVVFLFMQGAEKKNNTGLSGRLEFTGTYQFSKEDNPEIYSTDVKLDATEIPCVIFKGHFDREIPANQTVFLRVCNLNVVILCNGEEIYSFDSAEEENFGMQGNIWSMFSSVKIEPSDDIEVILYSSGKMNIKNAYNEFMNTMYAGDSVSFLRYMLKYSGLNLLFALIITMLGIFLMILTVTMLKLKMLKRLALLWLSLFILTAGVWQFTSFRYIWLITPLPQLVSMISVISICFIIIWLTLYLVHFVHGVMHYILVVAEYATLAYILFFLWGSFLQKGSYGLFMNLLYVLLAIDALLTLFCLAYETAVYKPASTRSVLKSYAVMLLFSGMEVGNLFYHVVPSGILISLGLVIFVIVQIVHSMGYINRNMLTIQDRKELEKDLLQSQIALMISQIKPHFIFNTLNAIGDVCISDPEKAEQAIIQFSKYLRSNIMFLEGKDLVDFSDEMENIKNYVQIEQLRFGDKIAFQTDIQTDDFSVPLLSVQPLVENSIKHGLRPKAEGGIVKVSTREQKRSYTVVVEDNGIGFQPEDILEKESSIGVRNICKRFEMVCQARVKIESRPGQGTRVTIEIPKNKKNMSGQEETVDGNYRENG